jgi:hypothetical protein
MEADTECPYCGEPISLWIDTGGGSRQRYIEDCSVCCRPFEVVASEDEDGLASVTLRRLDE